MTVAPEICPCLDDRPDPCPACGATVAAGVCKARRPRTAREIRAIEAELGLADDGPEIVVVPHRFGGAA